MLGSVLCWLWLTSCWSREPQTLFSFAHSTYSHGPTTHCYNWIVDMTPVVGDRCVSSVKAVKVDQSFELHGMPALYADPLTLLVQAVWKEIMTSCLNLITAIKNWSQFRRQHSCACTCAFAIVSGHWLGSVSGGKGDRPCEVTCAWPLLSPLSCLSSRNKGYAV